ncbi:MAG TPA: Fis family transcriptional regulator, partial [Pusillimonas sp.]|nr:Fis family transcriptional regulator [Pusillimonas sp.]
MNYPNPIEQCVREHLERYFADLGETEPHDILAMVVNCVEKP